MPTYHVFGADESYTIIEFDDDDKAVGEFESWVDVKKATLDRIAGQLKSHPPVFVPDLRHTRMRKLLHHLRTCANFSDYQWGIRYKDFMNPNVNYPLD